MKTYTLLIYELGVSTFNFHTENLLFFYDIQTKNQFKSMLIFEF